MTMMTTLKKLHKPNAVDQASGEHWDKLLAYLGTRKPDKTPVSLRTVYEVNGVDSAIWALRAIDGYDREIRLFAIWCARRVLHLVDDVRCTYVMEVAESFAEGRASTIELDKADEAGEAATLDADGNLAIFAISGVADASAYTAARCAAAYSTRALSGAASREVVRESGVDLARAEGSAEYEAVMEEAPLAWYAAHKSARSAVEGEFERMLDATDAGLRYEINGDAR